MDSTLRIDFHLSGIRRLPRNMVNNDFHGKLALVTGATGGIGKVTCRKLAELGCNIAVHYNSAKDTAEELVQELGSLGVTVQAFQADMSSYDNVSMSSAVLPYTYNRSSPFWTK